jgi:hypothetical protein
MKERGFFFLEIEPRYYRCISNTSHRKQRSGSFSCGRNDIFALEFDQNELFNSRVIMLSIIIIIEMSIEQKTNDFFS